MGSTRDRAVGDRGEDRTMFGRFKAKAKELRGRMEESDGIVLEDERRKREGRRMAEQGRAEAEAARARSARRHHGRHAK
ncbi:MULTISPECIES: hypothetical protein [Streptomyces]|uniref:CsbD family protein n=1 Tax=Streptomyces sanyensis TaxID=568869 RepID=A0ABP9B9Y6_9ACTN